MWGLRGKAQEQLERRWKQQKGSSNRRLKSGRDNSSSEGLGCKNNMRRNNNKIGKSSWNTISRRNKTRWFIVYQKSTNNRGSSCRMRRDSSRTGNGKGTGAATYEILSERAVCIRRIPLEVIERCQQKGQQQQQQKGQHVAEGAPTVLYLLRVAACANREAKLTALRHAHTPITGLGALYPAEGGETCWEGCKGSGCVFVRRHEVGCVVEKC